MAYCVWMFYARSDTCQADLCWLFCQPCPVEYPLSVITVAYCQYISSHVKLASAITLTCTEQFLNKRFCYNFFTVVYCPCLPKAPDLQDTRLKYFIVSSLNDLFERVDNRNIVYQRTSFFIINCSFCDIHFIVAKYPWFCHIFFVQMCRYEPTHSLTLHKARCFVVLCLRADVAMFCRQCAFLRNHTTKISSQPRLEVHICFDSHLAPVVTLARRAKNEPVELISKPRLCRS